MSDFAAIARSWINTPWMPNACVKGVGVSCQKLMGGIFKETGHLPESVVIPDGPMNWSVAHKSSLIEAFIDSDLQPYFAPVVDRWPQPMDMISFKIGGCGHHLGVMVAADPPSFVHILFGRSVIESRLDDASWLKRMNRVWRPIK